MTSFLSRHRLIVGAVAVGTLAVGLSLAFAVFGIHTAFIDDEVAEAGPTFESGADATSVVQGTFVDRSHPARGTASVLTDGTQRFLRFEEFATDNGPDLDVYLSSAPADAPAGDFDDDFVGLGDLKGNIGSQNYEIPADVDLDRYSTVVIWCVRFGVAFGAAELG